MTLTECIKAVEGTDREFIYTVNDDRYKVSRGKLFCWIYYAEERWVESTSGFLVKFLTSDSFELVKVKREGWVNVYPDSSDSIVRSIYSTREQANGFATHKCIGCVKIEWEE